ncbi:MAG: ABC transporter permease subunit [Burkholderiaceae bacterium]|nr:ABC transporter permease subunit [Burkholderiaceae bacterium]
MRLLVALICCLISCIAQADTLKIGSKRFTESYILCEVLAQSAESRAQVERKPGLGNTAIVFEALKSGSIDLYPEYTGTIALELLHRKDAMSLEEMNRELAPMGLGVAVPLGFNDGYALALRGADRQRLGLNRLSDLAAHPDLRLGLSHEFLGRADGWPGLAARYHLPQQPTGIDHGVAYQALAQSQVDLIDIYTTDAQIQRLGLFVLADDAGYFPRYDAVLLYRLDVPQRFPQAWQALRHLQGRITEHEMVTMNAAAELEHQSFAAIAHNWLHPAAGQATASDLRAKLFDGNLWRLTREHVLLVLLSVLAAAVVGIPLGMLAAAKPWLNQPVKAVVDVLQTIPSLALLAMLIPLLGRIGTAPALIALFLYALLPIVRNTCTGILQVPRDLKLAAAALALSRVDTMRFVVLPLAAPVIVSGIKTAAVMSVGTATIAAFIGAGGYGERIATGLALNDNDMLLAGAIPAAALALLTQLLFELAERLLRKR